MLLAALAVTAVAVTAGSPAPAAPAFRPPRVTMVTDSVGGVLFWVGAAREELAAGLDFHLETKTCRKLVASGCFAYGEVPPSALDTIRALGPDIGRIVIVDVGYNDPAEEYAAGLDRVMDALGAAGVEHVVWVTLTEQQPSWSRIDGVIEAATTRWPTLTIADWSAAAAGHSEWFTDGPHLSYDGGMAFARFLRPIVLGVCGTACARPVPLATLLAPRVRGHEAVLRWTGNDAARSFDVSVRRGGGTWKTVASRLTAASFRVAAVAGTRLQARVRARDEDGTPGRWSQARAFRL